MITPIAIRNITVGPGEPGVIVPIVSGTAAGIIAKAEEIARLPIEMVEWRADFYQDIRELPAVLAVLAALRAALGEIPLLFTYRSVGREGQQPVSREYYAALALAAARSGSVDLVDVEMLCDDAATRRLTEDIQAAGVLVVGSDHDFRATPPRDELVARLRRMQAMGADILKLAVTPTCPEDVLALLSATSLMRERYADRPLLTMAMGPLGVVSRLCGEVFGSALTFGAVGQTSAPGQIPVAELSSVLDILHQAL